MAAQVVAALAAIEQAQELLVVALLLKVFCRLIPHFRIQSLLVLEVLVQHLAVQMVQTDLTQL
jgi:hypothetical protein